MSFPAGMVVAFAALAGLGDGDEFRARLAGCVVMVGLRPEVSLPRFADRFGCDAAHELAAYWSRVRTWTPAQPSVTSKLLIASARQSTGRPKVDLVAEHRALVSCPDLAAAVHNVLSAHPDVDALAGQSRAASMFAVGSDVILEISSSQPSWPAALGGPPLANELSRSFRLVCRHAAWRDRELRRLAALDIFSIQAWPGAL